MKLTYQMLNEMYSVILTQYDNDNESDYTDKLAKTINITDECRDECKGVTIILEESSDEVYVKFYYSTQWPDYLYEAVNNGDVDIVKVDGHTTKIEILE